VPSLTSLNDRSQFRFVSVFVSENAEASLDEISLIMDRIK